MLRPVLSSLTLASLVACSGSSGVGTSPGPTQPGPGMGATSSYVFFTGQRTPSGQVLPFIAELGTGRVRSLATLMQGGSVETAGTFPLGVSPDGRFIALTGSKGAGSSGAGSSGAGFYRYLIDVAAGTAERRPLPSIAFGVRAEYHWSPDGSRLASLIRGVQGASSLELTVPETHLNSTPSLTLPTASGPLSWSGDSSYFALRSFTSGTDPVAVDLVDRDGNLVSSLLPPGTDLHGGRMIFGASSLAFTPDTLDSTGQPLFNQLYTHDPSTGTSVVRSVGTPYISDLLWSPDGEWICWGDDLLDGTNFRSRRFVLDTLSGGPQRELLAGAGLADASHAVWNPVTPDIAWTRRPASSGSAVALCVTNAAGQTDMFELPIGTIPNGTTWSPDGRFLAFAPSGGTAHVWEPFSGTPPTQLLVNGMNAGAQGLAWSPDSQHLAWLGFAAPSDRFVATWSPGDGTIARQLEGEAAFAADSTVHVIPTSDSAGVVWQKQQGPMRALMYTEFAAPNTTRVISSEAGLIDLVQIGRVTVR